MARQVKKRKPDPQPTSPLAATMEQHLEALRSQNYSEYTVKNRRVHIGFFLTWANEHGLSDPLDITRPILERYQRYLFHYRQKNGQPLSFRSQHSRLVPLRVWFRWMARQRLILHNPASELELPRLGHRLPKHVLTISEAEQVLAQPDVTNALGLRDRALMETLYSTGMRRLELASLKLYDLDTERGTVMIRQGKGKKDRVIPIGERAAAWIEKYVRESRPQLVVEPDDGTVFLSNAGEPFSLDHLSDLVRVHVDASKIGKRGACHLFRHNTETSITLRASRRRAFSTEIQTRRMECSGLSERSSGIDSVPDRLRRGHRFLRNSSSGSGGRYRPGRVLNGAVRDRAFSLSARSASK